MDDLSSKDRELVKNKDEEGRKNEDVDEYRGIVFKIVNKWKK